MTAFLGSLGSGIFPNSVALDSFFLPSGVMYLGHRYTQVNVSAISFSENKAGGSGRAQVDVSGSFHGSGSSLEDRVDVFIDTFLGESGAVMYKRFTCFS